MARVACRLRIGSREHEGDPAVLLHAAGGPGLASVQDVLFTFASCLEFQFRGIRARHVRLGDAYRGADAAFEESRQVLLAHDGCRELLDELRIPDRPGIVFDGGGRIEFVDASTGAPANIADDGSDLALRHIAANGTVRAVQGAIVHTADNHPAALANNLDPGGAEHAVSGIDADGNFLIGFEDKTDFDFNDLVVRIDPGQRLDLVAAGEPITPQETGTPIGSGIVPEHEAPETVHLLGVEGSDSAAHFALA